MIAPGYEVRVTQGEMPATFSKSLDLPDRKPLQALAENGTPIKEFDPKVFLAAIGGAVKKNSTEARPFQHLGKVQIFNLAFVCVEIYSMRLGQDF